MEPMTVLIIALVVIASVVLCVLLSCIVSVCSCSARVLCCVIRNFHIVLLVVGLVGIALLLVLVSAMHAHAGGKLHRTTPGAGGPNGTLANGTIDGNDDEDEDVIDEMAHSLEGLVKEGLATAELVYDAGKSALGKAVGYGRNALKRFMRATRANEALLRLAVDYVKSECEDGDDACRQAGITTGGTART